MADYSMFTRGTANEALSQNSEFARFSLMAAGFTPIDGQDPQAERMLGSYNGGISDRRVSRIVRDDRMFRFSDSKYGTLEERAAGG